MRRTYHRGPSFAVKIDGADNVLTLVYLSGAGYQYNTRGNESGHTFRGALQVGDKFRTGGHEYQIIEKL